MAVFSLSDLSKLFGGTLVFLSKSPFKLKMRSRIDKCNAIYSQIPINVIFKCDLLPNNYKILLLYIKELVYA